LDEEELTMETKELATYLRSAERGLAAILRDAVKTIETDTGLEVKGISVQTQEAMVRGGKTYMTISDVKVTLDV